ncbi:hypothetical protein BGZ83_001023 [Gryganskiella cystojenkinii]|nr:hypothetical protein BGZ83_001023 [Gryganskiella cystojenkinii]
MSASQEQPRPNGSPQFMDLSDDILLRIFGFIAESQDPVPTSHSDPPQEETTSKKSKKKTKVRVAGLGARSLCRLCCCSHRLNHIASADQLWKPLTLSRFSDRHWPTTDQKALHTIEVRREHQRMLLRPSSASGSLPVVPRLSIIAKQPEVPKDQDRSRAQPKEHDPSRKHELDVGDADDSATADSPMDPSLGDNQGPRKKQERTKFYSRFEQRAHRRKFTSLDPELKYTPLAWTNTFWTWKRTFFGDCRFVEAQDVSTPNRIGTIRILKTSFKYCTIVIGKDFKAGRSQELDQALGDPNCTPLLLYPSHDAVDIQTLVSATHVLNPQSSVSMERSLSSRYSCAGCQHTSGDTEKEDAMNDFDQQSEPKQLGEAIGGALDTPSPYPYKLVIALDGSWSHAKIMYRCNPRLQQLTQIKFPNPPQSIYHELKPEPKVTYTSTAEAVGQAVALLGWPGDRSNGDLLLEP